MENAQNLPNRTPQVPSKLAAWTLLGAIFLAVQFASLFTPPLLDDVDASTHRPHSTWTRAATGSRMKLNGIRYLEKPPLPYWLDAAGYWIFGQNVFATHLPNALAILVSHGWHGCGARAVGAGEQASMPHWECSLP